MRDRGVTAINHVKGSKIDGCAAEHGIPDPSPYGMLWSDKGLNDLIAGEIIVPSVLLVDVAARIML